MAFRLDIDPLTEQLIIQAYQNQVSSAPSSDQSTVSRTVSRTDNSVDLFSVNIGQLQSDILIGDFPINGNSDTFILGDSQQPYYANAGDNDFATILNFERSNDVIQLHGTAQDYRLVQTIGGTEIYLQQVTGSDLIGILPLVYDLNLNTNSFAFQS